jgi:3'(2'), 5'-bisphosphate nucleotidase
MKNININDIVDIARNAGNIIMRYYGKDPEVTVKGDSTPVTEADYAADKYIRKELKRLFPNHKILSEETDNDISDYSGYVWMVDPLDGTSTFAIPEKKFSSIIGLCKDGVPILGVVYAPALGKAWYAEKGKGAFAIEKSGLRKMHASRTKVLQNAKGIIKPGKTRLNEFPCHVYSQESGAAIKIMDIADGNYDFHIDATYKASKWDVCGTQVILEEAGGKLTDVRGNPIDYQHKESTLPYSFMTSNGVLHKDIVKESKRLL